MIGSTRPLFSLARALGVQASYRDVTGRRRRASTEDLMAVLSALGGQVHTPEDAAAVLERRRGRRAERPVEPVVVAWDGRLAGLEVRVPGPRRPARLKVRIDLEGGEERAWSVRTDEVRTGEATATLHLDGELPFGRHSLTVEAGRRTGTATLLSAPRRVRAAAGPREWGVFLPLHALVTARDWGIGDLTGLGELADHVRELGGGVVGTLPLLARLPDEESPYRPTSRLFWDEVFIDVTAVPELERDPDARRLVGSAAFRGELRDARSGPLVDRARVLALKRRVLEGLARSVDGDRAAALARFVRENPEVERFARFRAAAERLGPDHRRWGPAARAGRLRPSDLDRDAVEYHRFAQWVAEEQLAGAGRHARAVGAGLYLDLPLGVHPGGFDVWRRGSMFVPSMSVGAPPDSFFPGGQVWDFPPQHPEQVREDGYAYPLACLRHTFRHAGVARVDHAIGLHRQYWVPDGATADRGVFVRYPAEEWYAAISLEAHRTRTVVVGEDLGTVPAEVRRTMDRHRVLRSYVLGFEIVPDRRPAVAHPPANSLATLNTHDLPTFASFWRGTDAAIRGELTGALVASGLLRPGDADDERAVLSASLAWLASSDARLVVLNLEDLWGELRSQNVPGVVDGTNWRRRAARSLEELATSAEAATILRRVDAARQGALAEGDAA